MSAEKQSEWGRVAEDGTVWVRTATAENGERAVGSYPAGTPEEALAFFTERFAALEFEVQLLVQRVNGSKVSPDEAAATVKQVREQVQTANAVGDLDGLVAKLDALGPVIATQREAKKAERVARTAESKVAKERLVAEAETLAEGTDWRDGANRLRVLLDEWKALPRLDKPTDDALWRRFSTARTTYTRHRKAHFAEQNERRDKARGVKERLVAEAEALSTSTDWGLTAGRYRDLMREWKNAGPAPREVEDKLWKRFRGAQDAFFGARDEANALLDAEFAGNAEVKEAILVEAEALLPVTDLEAAKAAFRDLADRWDEAGKVPRDRIRDLEGRMRKVETAIRQVEDEAWKKSDPEKSGRANDMVTQLEQAIAEVQAKVDAARAAGDEKKAAKLEADIVNRQAFLEMARKAAEEFSG